MPTNETWTWSVKIKWVWVDDWKYSTLILRQDGKYSKELDQTLQQQSWAKNTGGEWEYFRLTIKLPNA